MKNLLTIFTPVYNRAEYVGRLFDSLKCQTCKNFEWIALDDGSVDDSLKVLYELRDSQNDFPVTVMHTENGGKHRAINKAVWKAQGEYFFILDSDDYILPDAVANIHSWIEDIKREPDYKYFAGVSGFRTDGQNILGGNGIGTPYIDALNTERDKYNLTGDKAEVYKTAIMRNFPFVEFEGEKFLSEATVWDMIATAGFKLRWYSVPILVCNYLSGGLSELVPDNEVNCFDGFTYFMKIERALYGFSWFKRLSLAGHYAAAAKKKGLTVQEAAKRLGVRPITLRWTRIVWSTYKNLQGRRRV